MRAGARGKHPPPGLSARASLFVYVHGCIVATSLVSIEHGPTRSIAHGSDGIQDEHDVHCHVRLACAGWSKGRQMRVALPLATAEPSLLDIHISVRRLRPRQSVQGRSKAYIDLYCSIPQSLLSRWQPPRSTKSPAQRDPNTNATSPPSSSDHWFLPSPV